MNEVFIRWYQEECGRVTDQVAARCARGCRQCAEEAVQTAAGVASSQYGDRIPPIGQQPPPPGQVVVWSEDRSRQNPLSALIYRIACNQARQLHARHVRDTDIDGDRAGGGPGPAESVIAADDETRLRSDLLRCLRAIPNPNRRVAITLRVARIDRPPEHLIEWTEIATTAEIHAWCHRTSAQQAQDRFQGRVALLDCLTSRGWALPDPD